MPSRDGQYPDAAPGEFPDTPWSAFGSPTLTTPGVFIMPSQFSDKRVDVGGDVPLLSAYTFAQAGAVPGSLTGYFVDITGKQQTALMTLSITSATTLTALYNLALALVAGTPLAQSASGGFLGFAGILTGGPVFVGTGGNSDGTLAAGQSPAAGYPVLYPGASVAFGRVSPFLLASPGPAIPTTASVQRVNAGFSAPGQTIKNYVGSVQASATVPVTVTLETVTAGKIYIITDIYISANSSTPFEARIQSNGTDIFRAWCKGDTSPIEMSGIESQPNASAGQVVTLLIPTIAGAPLVAFFLGGMEQ